VTVEGLELIEHLPVMDNRNHSIPANQVTSFDVNKALKRCLTKAIAAHGLGLYVYAGEDLPDAADNDLREETNKAIAQTVDSSVCHIALLLQFREFGGRSLTDGALLGSSIAFVDISTNGADEFLLHNRICFVSKLNVRLQRYGKKND
jgi:hypothetical protein